MIAVGLLTVLCAAVSASAIPRDIPNYVPPGACCFTLNDASNGQIVRQDPVQGLLYLGGSQPTGWYCLNLSDDRDILLDRFANACFEQSSDFKFKCLDPIPGIARWSLTVSGGKTILAHDSSTSYKACKDKAGNGLLYTDKTKISGCRAVKLAAEGLKGTCGKFAS